MWQAPHGSDALTTPGDVAHALRGTIAPQVAAGFAISRPKEVHLQAGGDVEWTFDLASLTKPMTALALLAAGFDPAAPLATYLPEFAHAFAGRATIGALMAHRSGLAGHIPLFAPLLAGLPFDRNAALRGAANAKRETVDATQVGHDFDAVYSDCGYILLGEALARTTGARDAGAAIRELVVTPLALQNTLGTVRDLGADKHYAPTEDAPFRGGIVCGAVHDENAWALTGYGGSGHAGMFGTVNAVLNFASAVHCGARFGEGPFGRLPLAWLLAARAGGTFRAGFDGKSAHGSSAGERASSASYGHLGFTGTSFWIDPTRDAVTVLLTNRVHPTRENSLIRLARPWAHDALFAQVDAFRSTLPTP